MALDCISCNSLKAGGLIVLGSARCEVLDFKTADEKGIKSGRIKSIIHPSLASHARREAVRFVDELMRV